jgi:hypothetical protein
LAKKNGKGYRAYVPDLEKDVPAARFMFCVLCEDQKNGSRGNTYPETLETAGIYWPGEIEDLDSLI